MTRSRFARSLERLYDHTRDALCNAGADQPAADAEALRVTVAAGQAALDQLRASGIDLFEVQHDNSGAHASDHHVAGADAEAGFASSPTGARCPATNNEGGN